MLCDFQLQTSSLSPVHWPGLYQEKETWNFPAVAKIHHLPGWWEIQQHLVLYFWWVYTGSLHFPFAISFTLLGRANLPAINNTQILFQANIVWRSGSIKPFGREGTSPVIQWLKCLSKPEHSRSFNSREGMKTNFTPASQDGFLKKILCWSSIFPLCAKVEFLKIKWSNSESSEFRCGVKLHPFPPPFPKRSLLHLTQGDTISTCSQVLRSPWDIGAGTTTMLYFQIRWGQSPIWEELQGFLTLEKVMFYASKKLRESFCPWSPFQAPQC